MAGRPSLRPLRAASGSARDAGVESRAAEGRSEGPRSVLDAAAERRGMRRLATTTAGPRPGAGTRPRRRRRGRSKPWGCPRREPDAAARLVFTICRAAWVAASIVDVEHSEATCQRLGPVRGWRRSGLPVPARHPLGASPRVRRTRPARAARRGTAAANSWPRVGQEGGWWAGMRSPHTRPLSRNCGRPQDRQRAARTDRRLLGVHGTSPRRDRPGGNIRRRSIGRAAERPPNIFSTEATSGLPSRCTRK